MHKGLAERRWQESKGLVRYVGEWHTYPQDVPSPSAHADSGDPIIGMTATLEPNSVTVQQSQNRLKVAGQDGLIDIQISAFGIGVESLDRAQVRRSRVVSPVPEFELDVDERNEYGQRRRITSLYKQR